MSSVVAFPCSLAGKGSLFGRESKGRKGHLRRPMIGPHFATPSTFSSRISTDIPFDEAPEASFSRYLEDKPRVFEAIFPEKQASQQLNHEEWRIHMLPIESPFLTLWPIVDMRLKCTSNVSEYPSSVPHNISKILELEIIRSEFRGLEVLKQAGFTLGVKGAMYSEKRGLKSRLKGQTLLSISFDLPPILALFSQHICRDAAEMVLRRCAEDMKHTMNASLLEDYREFTREKLKD